jgi:hypothetical protein
VILYATSTWSAIARQSTFHSNIVTGETVFPHCHYYLTAADDSFGGSGEDVVMGFK